MPSGPLIGIFHWLASHLVVWSLLGFVVAGLVVFDVVQLPARSGITTSATASAARPAVEVPVADRAGAQPAVTAGDREPRPIPREAAKRPRLIGGSLPLYDDRPGGGQESVARRADGFRPATGTEPATPLAAPDYHEGVQRARRAFWNGDFEASEAAYMDVVTAFPDDPEAFGELGNLYEAMGKAELARDAFFAAGVRLKNRGNDEKLRKVIDLLAEKGDERSMLLAPP